MLAEYGFRALEILKTVGIHSGCDAVDCFAHRSAWDFDAKTAIQATKSAGMPDEERAMVLARFRKSRLNADVS
jgi:hypothetical protein